MSSVASDQPSVRLSHVLAQFESPLSEEQAWGLAHQSFICFRDHFLRKHSLLVSAPHHLFLTTDGHVHPHTLTAGQSCIMHISLSDL